METFHWSILLGGFTFFFFGLKSARDGLQAAAGDRLRAVLGRLTSNRVAALILGMLITIMLQSSGATSVMLVSFAETNLVTLAQAIAVLLGADIGTTLTVFLLSVQKITAYALIIVTIGFFLQAMSSKSRGKQIGAIILGFGMIFYGMELMSTAAIPLNESPLAVKAFGFLAGHPLATLFLATIVAGALHSAGTIGIAMALGFSGTISFEAAIPIVLGANVGTCITVILCGVGSGVEGRRVAAAHTVSKVIGVAIAFPFIAEIATLANTCAAWCGSLTIHLEPGVAGRIVITHVFFNVALAIVFLPLIRLLVWGVRRVIPEPPSKEEEFKPKYLDPAAISTPAIAFAQVKREILRMAAIVGLQLDNCLRMFSRGLEADEEVAKIIAADDKIDLLEKSIRFYLARISSENLSESLARRQLTLLTIAQDLEEIGDTISREMAIMAKKKAGWRRIFSDEGWDDLRSMQRLVRENYELAVSALAQPAGELLAKVFRHELHMNEVEQGLRQSHLHRLHQGLKESVDTSSIHLEILLSLRRINSKVTHIVKMSAEL